MESRPVLQLSFFFRLIKCAVQCKSSCSKTTKYLILDNGWTFSNLMLKLRCLVTFLCLDLNMTSSILLVFKGQFISSTPFSNKFLVSIHVSVYLFEWFFNKEDISVISWINYFYEKGPRTDPCGTLILVSIPEILRVLELIPAEHWSLFSSLRHWLFSFPWHWNSGLVSSGVTLTSWGEGASLALLGNPSSDGVTIKMPYRVDVLHQPALHPIFFYWVG